MRNQHSEIILDPSLKEKRLAELNQKFEDVYREVEKRLAELNQKFEDVYREVEKFLLESGFSEEEINNFLQRVKVTTNSQLH